MKKLKMTKAQEEKELKMLRRKCLLLWTATVKKKAGGKCEYCGEKTRLNAHHIESFITNKILRFDFRNGMALCPRHHKFGHFSAHRSFLFVYEMMTKRRKEDLEYLINVRSKPIKLSKEYLLSTINKLNGGNNG